MWFLYILILLMASTTFAHDGLHEHSNKTLEKYESMHNSSSYELNFEIRMARFSKGLSTDRDQEVFKPNKFSHPGHGVSSGGGLRATNETTASLTGNIEVLQQLILHVETAFRSTYQKELSLGFSHTLMDKGRERVFYSVGVSALYPTQNRSLAEPSFAVLLGHEQPKYHGLLTVGYQVTTLNLLKSSSQTSHLLRILYSFNWHDLIAIGGLLVSLEPAFVRPGLTFGLSFKLI